MRGAEGNECFPAFPACPVMTRIRLIPSRYTEKDESVLARLTDDAEDLSALFELEGATNDRLLGEAGLLPGITVQELVFGLSYSHIVNAAFTHARPLGSRFNGPERGAWYAAFSRQTSETEVARHKARYRRLKQTSALRPALRAGKERSDGTISK